MKTTNRFLPGLTFVTFYIFVASCGATPPDIDEGYCPKWEDPSSVSVTVASDASTAAGVGGGTSADSTSSTGGDPEEVPQYDSPATDEIVSRLHSCHKLTYAQLGNFLRARGALIPPGNLSDLKTTQSPAFGMSQTLGTIFGGSGAACEMAVTDANGTNDPLCPTNESCFCNQDDKLTQNNRGCLDVGNNSPDAADGYCVAKPSTPGFLYFTGKDALGVPKLDSRLSEKEEHSTASAMKLMDIFVQAAAQIIANIGDSTKAPACTLNGKNLPMFASDGSCVEESVTCLIGTPATDDHMLLCNLILQKAKPGDQSDLMKKKNIAVAALLSAAHSCQ